MPNEQDNIIESENNEKEVEVGTEVEPEEQPKEKTKRTPQEELKYHEGRAQRIRKDLGMETPEKPQKNETPKTGELDEATLDFLDVKGLTEEEDIDVVRNVMQRTGQTARQALKDDYVISKLNDNKKAREVKVATPSSTKRSGQQSTDNEDYWFQKYEATGELPKGMPHGMAAKLVNRKAGQSDTRKNPFE